MRRTYLIDSENINDVWVELLQVLEDGDEILVFYTDKSAHMGYDRIVCLMEQKRGAVHWIKCFEGGHTERTRARGLYLVETRKEIGKLLKHKQKE